MVLAHRLQVSFAVIRRNEMKHIVLTAILVVGLSFLTFNYAHPEPLAGPPGSGSGPGWSAGWVDLSTITDFKRGEAQVARGRNSRKYSSKAFAKGSLLTPVGIDGGVVRVPKNRIVEVVLKQDHRNIVQISVHGNQKAWQYNLGGGNGLVTLDNVERVSP